jgi:glycosyltransferase involved in cell wall biosynthesis
MYTIVFPVNKLNIGGAEQQLLELVRGLDKRQFLPIVASIYAGGPLEPEFRAVPGAELVNLNRKNKYDPSTLFRMTTLLRRRRADIVQPFLSPATFFGLTSAIVANTPIKIVTERCGVRRFRGLGYTTYRITEDLLSLSADAVVSNSVAGEDLLRSRGIPASKIHVFYNGVNPERLEVDRPRAEAFRASLGVPRDGKVVSILASLTPPKDHATFIRAAARVNAEYPQTRFAIIGDGALRADLEALSGDLNMQGRIAFLGYQRRVADLLAGSDLLVSSSRDNEGCSNSILEAMFLDVPVVATDIGGNRELIQHGRTGYLCPAQDDVALANAIRACFSNAVATDAMAARARDEANARFSLHRMVSDYEGLYQHLLEVKGRSRSRSTAAAVVDRPAEAP